MGLSPFTRNILLLLWGPLVWALHFVAIYGWTGVVCARPAWPGEWLGASLVTWGVLGAGALACAALAAGLLARPRTDSEGNRAFLRQVSLGLGALALVAIVFETAGLFLLPACASVT